MIAWLLKRAASCLCLFCAASAAAGVVRTKADLRLWQTVDDRAAPLEWPWADDADSAALVFSNRLTGAVSSATVSRGEGEMRGGCAQPRVDQVAEALFDVTLMQKKGSVVVAEDAAVLAYVRGAGGGPITVRTKRAHDWHRVHVRRIFAFDPAWLGLDGDSGYDIALPYIPGLRITIF